MGARNGSANGNGAAPVESLRSAREAGLRYVSDAAPGISRVAAGKGFAYAGPDGRRITDEAVLRRIRSLAIPPAYQDVWICPDASGHIQAVARDARGRKQYRYHPRWREVRDDHKYGRVIAFAKALPKMRARLRRDLKRPGMSREKVLATVVQIMEKTLIRVGNDEYARQNGSYGLTTMRNKHAKVRSGKVHFQFRGKSGKTHSIELDDPRLARIVKNCQELPGHELFEYVDDDGTVRDIGSADVNAYLREIAGEEFTAKDFRTWAGTVLAAQALQALEQGDTKAQVRRNLMSAIERVAQRLGNTKAVCRKCYVHPEVLNAYMDGSLMETLRQRTAGMAKSRLPAEEAAVLRLLQARLAKSKEPMSKKLKASIKAVRAAKAGGPPGSRGARDVQRGA
jgi:DNA topoisomerase-1